MIKFTLKCDQDHSFESWFQSNEAFETLQRAGHLSCAICGSADVKKSLMAPRVVLKGNVERSDPPDGSPLSAPQNDAEKALSALRKKVETDYENVGENFAQEARDMHLGDAPERLIYGTAAPQEAKALIDDGVPVMPLPIIPKEKAN